MLYRLTQRNGKTLSCCRKLPRTASGHRRVHNHAPPGYAQSMSAPVPANQARQVSRQVVMVYKTRVQLGPQGKQTPVKPELLGEFPVFSPHVDERKRLARAEVTRQFGYTQMSIATGRKVRGEPPNRGRILLVTVTDPAEFPEATSS